MSTLPRSRSTDKRYYGLVEAIVMDVNDPDHEGRVKLKFPWFDQQMVTEWCRVRQFYAGNNYGAFFIPEQDDEVLVSFIHGDMRLPVILGGLYNGKDKPPTYRDGSNKDQKMLKTKAGHIFLLDDSQGKEKVTFTTQGGHHFDLNDEDKKAELKTAGNHVITVDDQNRKITIKSAGGHSVELDDSGQSVKVQASGGGSVTLQSGTVSVQGTTVNVQASTINLGGSAAQQQLVLGTEFMTLFNAHVHTCSASGAPSTQPLTQMPSTMLSSTTKTV